MTAADLELVLALAQAGTLAAAASRLGVDTSTVFRAIQRLEKHLGQSIFKRSRKGYAPTDLGVKLLAHAKQIDSELEAARAAALDPSDTVTGTVRITSTDSILEFLVLPVLPALRAAHPQLTLELAASYSTADLSRRDADIALRGTRSPPPHLIGKRLGVIREAVFARREPDVDPTPYEERPWVAFDEAIPAHPSIAWRQRAHPAAKVAVQVSSISMAGSCVASGLGVAVLPLFVASSRSELVQLTEPIDDCSTELWLLMHPELRPLRRVAAVFAFLSRAIKLN